MFPFPLTHTLSINLQNQSDTGVKWGSKSPPFSFDTSSEIEIKNYLDKNIIDPIEGIWIWTNAETGQNYAKTAIIKKGKVFYNYLIIIKITLRIQNNFIQLYKDSPIKILNQKGK